MTNTTASAAKPWPSIPAGFAALSLIGVMLAGAWQFFASATNPDGLEFPRSFLDFREGRMTQGLEKQIDKKLPSHTNIIAVANTLRYLLTGGGGDQVRIGKSGWLFVTEELRYDADGAASLRVRTELLGAAARGLERQGVKLVVALVPDKARVHASHLVGGRYPEYNSGRYQDAMAALGRQKVHTVDLLEPLSSAARQGDVYYRTDTHWNQDGAKIAAEAVVKKIKELGIEMEKTSFNTESQGGSMERAGDLIRLMGLQDIPNSLRPRPDQESAATTKQTSADAAGLFGDAAVPVVLTGTSYSMRGNFHGFLQQALSAKVLNTAKDGAGFLQAATAYLSDDAYRSAKPKVLVWEVPERFLQTKLEDEPKWLNKVGLQP